MRTSPSSSSTMSTSITLAWLSSFIVFLVFAQQGLGRFPGKCPRWGGVLVLGGLIVHRLGRHGQREQEPRAFGTRRVQPDPAAEILDDLPGHGQADAGARVGAPLV